MAMIGFGENDSGIGQKFKSFKGETGKNYRISFAWYPIKDGKFDLSGSTPQFVKNDTHYIPNVGYVVNKGPEFTKLAGEPPKQRIGGVIIVWPTDKNGNLDKSRFATEWEVLPWIFSGDKFTQMKAIHMEFPFVKHDLKINCSDAQFQKMTFAPCSDSLLAQINASEKAKTVLDQIVAAVEALVPKMPDNIGREMTIQQIREKLAGGAGGAGGASGGSAGLGDNAAASGNIDALVDNILDG